VGFNVSRECELIGGLRLLCESRIVVKAGGNGRGQQDQDRYGSFHGFEPQLNKSEPVLI
jgi:hypothetical protein